MNGSVMIGSAFTGFWIILGMTLLAVAWIVAGIRLSAGDPMDKSNRIAQLYGYTVCLVAVLTFLISGSSFIESAMQRSAPLSGERFGYNALDYSSFETWKATREGPAAIFNRDANAAARPPEPDSVLRPRYEAMRASAIENGRVRATQSMIQSGFTILVAIALFVTHWTWLRKQRANGATAA